MRVPPPASLLPLALLASFAGCRLVDQRTFEQTGLFPAAPQLARADYAQRAMPAPPLATIRFGTADQGWQAGFIDAERAARERKAEVTFDVVAPFPSAAPRSVQDAALSAGGADGAQVARVLEADGVDANHIHLGARGDPGQPPRQVEVYVR